MKKVLFTLLLLLSYQTAYAVDEVIPVDFSIQVYPYGGYYSYPSYCYPGYYYGPGYTQRGRSFQFYFGPGSPSYYYGPYYVDPRCYYYGPGYRYDRHYYKKRYKKN